ncbi:MAG: peptidase, partial [Sediminibacterium sp.]|nr:peptidase [Sediminibacterium sp.]
YKMAADIVKKHTDFLVKLAGQQPEIDVINVKTEKLSNGLTRVSLDVINKGGLSTHSKLGERSYFLKKLKVAVKMDKQEIVGGRKITLLNSLEASASQSFSWLIKGSGKVSVEVGCPTAGVKNVDLTL